MSQRWVSGRLAGRSTRGSPLSRCQSHLNAGIRAELSPCQGPCSLVHKAFWMEPGGKAGLDSISCLAGTLMWPVAHSADSHTPSGHVQVGDTEFCVPRGHGCTGWCGWHLARNRRDHTLSAEASRETGDKPKVT